MTSKEAMAKYEEQLGYYKELNAIRSALVSIRGSFQAADLMFDFSKREMAACVNIVQNAEIILEDFDKYEKLLTDNFNIISSAKDNFSDFRDDIDKAFSRCESHMEIVHAYMTYLYNAYLSIQSDERLGRGSLYPPYTGEIFHGFGSSGRGW